MTLGNSATAHLVLSAVGVLSVPINTTHTMGTAGAGTAATGLNIIGQESGASGGAFIKFTRNATTIGFLGSKNVISGGTPTNAFQLYSSHADGVEAMADNAAGTFRIATGGTTTRFAVNANGDWLKGSNIMDSTGTPTINSGFKTSPSVAGTDYAFDVTVGTGGGATTGGDVAFGRTWTTAPVCVGNTALTNISPNTPVLTTISTSTTIATISFTSSTNDNIRVRVLCRGY